MMGNLLYVFELEKHGDKAEHIGKVLTAKTGVFQ